MKRFIIILPIIFILTGCQTSQNARVELNQNAGQILPVSAAAIDKTESSYVMSIESIRQDSLDGEVTPAYFSVSGKTFNELFEKADKMLSSRLDLSHASIILISENINSSELRKLTNTLLNRPDARLTLRIAIAKDCTPLDILKAPSVTDGIPGMALSSLLNQRAKDGTLSDFPLFRVLDYQLGDRSFSLPMLSLTDDGHATPYGNMSFTL